MEATLEIRIQDELNGYRPNLYMDGGDVEVQHIDEKGVVHLKMMGACIDCPISLLTMKLGIQRLLKEKFPNEVTGIHATTDIDISALYNRTGSNSNQTTPAQTVPSVATTFRSLAKADK